MLVNKPKPIQPESSQTKPIVFPEAIKELNKLGAVAHTSNPKTMEAEAKKGT